MSEPKTSGYCGPEPDDSRAAHSARPDAERAAQRERSCHLEAPTGGGQGVTSGDHCITCSDQGFPMRVVSLSDEGAVCIAEDGSRHERVAVELVEPVAPGDRVLVHAGVAIG